MTVAELKQGVALLGFEESLDALDNTAESHFWHAVNRALWTVNRLRPKKGCFPLYHYSPKNLLPYENYRHRGGVDLVFTAFGAKAYTFLVSGVGQCIIKNCGDETTLSWSTEKPKRFFGFLGQGEVSLSFLGDYDYAVSEMALWDATTGPNKEDIPSGTPYAKYHLPSIIEDFLRLDETPFFGQTPKEVRFLGQETVEIAREAEGCYLLFYRQRWQPLTENTEDTFVLPLEEDLCQLLPPLVASTLCLDADEEKAAYYRKIYLEEAREVAVEFVPHTPSQCTSVNGW